MRRDDLMERRVGDIRARTSTLAEFLVSRACRQAVGTTALHERGTMQISASLSGKDLRAALRVICLSLYAPRVGAGVISKTPRWLSCPAAISPRLSVRRCRLREMP